MSPPVKFLSQNKAFEIFLHCIKSTSGIVSILTVINSHKRFHPFTALTKGERSWRLKFDQIVREFRAPGHEFERLKTPLTTYKCHIMRAGSSCSKCCSAILHYLLWPSSSLWCCIMVGWCKLVNTKEITRVAFIPALCALIPHHYCAEAVLLPLPFLWCDPSELRHTPQQTSAQSRNRCKAASSAI